MHETAPDYWSDLVGSNAGRRPIAFGRPSTTPSGNDDTRSTLNPRYVLAEPAGDVVFGALVFGRGEHRRGATELDELTWASLIGKHEPGVVRDARGLLHVVGHD